MFTERIQAPLTPALDMCLCACNAQRSPSTCTAHYARTHAPTPLQCLHLHTTSTSTPMPPTQATQRVPTGEKRVKKSRGEERAPDAADISARIHRQRHTTRVLTPCARLSLSLASAYRSAAPSATARIRLSHCSNPLESTLPLESGGHLPNVRNAS